MKGIIDRFEGGYAVVEIDDGSKMINIDKILLPKGAKEGMVLQLDKSITIDIDETKKRKEKIEKLTADLWNE
ncbi:MAG: DUF3006 domain-containing protein [Clostridium sp.]|uniref:DUF3006 domain-containing protein n=1 Tax=Clostridium sp. TaxID=1506 RepID=UPI003D6CD2ED